MHLVKFAVDSASSPQVGVLDGETVISLGHGETALSAILHSDQALREVATKASSASDRRPVSTVQLLPPIDRQVVWGAGVTYERSKTAREEESKQASTFYDLVYRADRPELFFKAMPHQVVGPKAPIRIRRDARWTVPEPELGLVISPALKLVGLTAGNDVSARDIEGENPLYLPQAKVYDGCCALGPAILLTSPSVDPTKLEIHLQIHREGRLIFEGTASTQRMARRFEDLINWLGRDHSFPDGVILLTGTGIVPPDAFTLEPEDRVRITIEGIGVLENPVERIGEQIL